jgi:hypothetical protein
MLYQSTQELQSARAPALAVACAAVVLLVLLAPVLAVARAARPGNCVSLVLLTAARGYQSTYIFIPTHIRSKASRGGAKGDLPSQLRPHTQAVCGRRRPC